ncbi:hypothetical protein GM921_00465 [Pedobacter sp. LMG 31464]|uniref:Methylamine utilisation protein MauE domain-containing protein n=1 Tax=Pedobacter planticolens TaxID=2679964 RepID=A0A923DU89_9SPHI|nr:MauE/DoxX family redox-associated membrane protein [Pedobacter planticolens]MBB2143942.1 hypothetical protein [Pedobacter planticolens]
MIPKKYNTLAIQCITFLLILLWTYTALSKWSEPTAFRFSLYRQPFSTSFSDFIFWVLPLSELTAATLLVFTATRPLGFYLSTLLLTVFTIYIVIALLGVFEKVPCSCGGVLKSLGWKQHLLFNLVFFALSTYASLVVYQQKNRI